MCRTAVVLRSFLLVRRGTNNTEAYVAAPSASVGAAPVVHLARVDAPVVTAATADIAAAVFAGIPAPLIHIAAHVIKSIVV